MKKTAALEMMSKYDRFHGERPKFLPLAMINGVVGITGHGSTYSGLVRLFTAMPVAVDFYSPWWKEVTTAINHAGNFFEIAIHAMRTVETFIPVSYAGGTLHDRILTQRMRDPHAASASQVARDTLEFALSALGCPAPLMYGCVDPKTFELGFEAHVDDYAVLKIASPLTKARVDELVAETSKTTPFAEWAAQRHAKAEADAAYHAGFSRRREEASRRNTNVAA